jgi:hypothetical protein
MTEVAPTHTTSIQEEPPFVSRRPSTLRYRTLVEGLQKWATSVDESDVPAAPLLVAAAVVSEFLQFLQADPALEPEALHPVRMLFSALNDKVGGGTVAWLDSPPRPPGTTKPTGLYWHLLRGEIVGALNRLIGAGMKSKIAAQWLEREIALFGIRNPPSGNRNPTPTRITATQCLAWRARVSDGKAPSAQKLAADKVRSLFANKKSGDDPLAEAKSDARTLLANVRPHYFAHSPSSTANGTPPNLPPDAASGVS